MAALRPSVLRVLPALFRGALVFALSLLFAAGVLFAGVLFVPSFAAVLRAALALARCARIASICAIVDLELMMTGITIGLRCVLW